MAYSTLYTSLSLSLPFHSAQLNTKKYVQRLPPLVWCGVTHSWPPSNTRAYPTANASHARVSSIPTTPRWLSKFIHKLAELLQKGGGISSLCVASLDGRRRASLYAPHPEPNSISAKAHRGYPYAQTTLALTPPCHSVPHIIHTSFQSPKPTLFGGTG